MKNFRYRFVYVFALLIISLNGHSQCHPDSLEIPNNGIDEDCDGLDDLYLQLAPFFYAEQGTPFEVHFPNIILSTHPWDYVFEVTTSLGGDYDGDKWVWSASDGPGSYSLTVQVKKPNGVVLAGKSMTVRVVSNGSPSNMNQKRLLLIGHSYFAQGYLPNFLCEYVDSGNNPPISFHGTQASWYSPDCYHEGIGGATWSTFTGNIPPFYLNGVQVNVREYFEQQIGPGIKPDWIILYLDVNDFLLNGTLPGTTIAEIDNFITNVWSVHADRLLDSIAAVAPNAKIGISTCPPAHGYESAFSGYGPPVNNRFRWQKIVNRLAHLCVSELGTRPNVSILPMHIDMDDSTAYNSNDPIHPDMGACIGGPPYCGYKSIANQMYAWMRYQAFQAPPLPVELIRFEAKVEPEFVQLFWETASEWQNRGFTVQYSGGAAHLGWTWADIGFVPGIGPQGGRYTFQVSNPLPGANYYRLKQEDSDGSFAFSPVVQVYMGNRVEEMSIRPNPVGVDVHVYVSASAEMPGTLRVLDACGREMLHRELALLKSENRFDFSAAGWPTGIYSVQLLTVSGVYYRPVVVTRP